MREIKTWIARGWDEVDLSLCHPLRVVESLLKWQNLTGTRDVAWTQHKLGQLGRTHTQTYLATWPMYLASRGQQVDATVANSRTHHPHACARARRACYCTYLGTGEAIACGPLRRALLFVLCLCCASEVVGLPDSAHAPTSCPKQRRGIRV